MARALQNRTIVKISDLSLLVINQRHPALGTFSSKRKRSRNVPVASMTRENSMVECKSEEICCQRDRCDL